MGSMVSLRFQQPIDVFLKSVRYHSSGVSGRLGRGSAIGASSSGRTVGRRAEAVEFSLHPSKQRGRLVRASSIGSRGGFASTKNAFGNW